MHLRFIHTREEHHVYTFLAFVDDGESEDELTKDDFKCIASIGWYLVDTPQTMLDWQNTIATYVANMMRRDGFEIGEITFGDGHEYEPPVGSDECEE